MAQLLDLIENSKLGNKESQGERVWVLTEKKGLIVKPYFSELMSGGYDFPAFFIWNKCLPTKVSFSSFGSFGGIGLQQYITWSLRECQCPIVAACVVLRAIQRVICSFIVQLPQQFGGIWFPRLNVCWTSPRSVKGLLEGWSFPPSKAFNEKGLAIWKAIPIPDSSLLELMGGAEFPCLRREVSFEFEDYWWSSLQAL